MARDDSFAIPLDTETHEDTNTGKSRVMKFLGSAFLFLVVLGLTAMLVIQVILISSVTEMKASAAIDPENLAEAAEEIANQVDTIADSVLGDDTTTPAADDTTTPADDTTGDSSDPTDPNSTPDNGAATL